MLFTVVFAFCLSYISVSTHRCMCILGHVCVFVHASSTVSLWECSVLLSHGICPMSPCGDVRTEVRANTPLRGRRFTSCLSGPSWSGSIVEGWTVFMISQWIKLSLSLCLFQAMWLMLQQEEPQDFVIATGEVHSVREFVEKAFKHVGKTIVWVHTQAQIHYFLCLETERSYNPRFFSWRENLST